MIRRFLSLEAAAFAAGVLVHSGVMIQGYEHTRAATAESVIALVLLAALAASFMSPRAIRLIGLVAQGFGLLGTIVGLVTIAIGVGPRTIPDVVFHAGLVALLTTGLARTARRAQDRPSGLAGTGKESSDGIHG